MHTRHTNDFRSIALLALILIAAPAARAQKPEEFEVASVRLNTSGQESFNVHTSQGGRFEVRNISLERLIQLAFDLRASQVLASPGWTYSERYDIIAKADTHERPTLEDMKTWCQALLASRFGLRFHWETKQLSHYALVEAKGGAKLHPNTDAAGPEVSYGKGWIATSKTTVAEFASVLARSLDANVVDESGITGVFDFQLRWSPDDSADAPGPSLFTALREQCGLRVEPRKGPVKVIVIDQINRPAEN